MALANKYKEVNAATAKNAKGMIILTKFAHAAMPLIIKQMVAPLSKTIGKSYPRLSNTSIKTKKTATINKEKRIPSTLVFVSINKVLILVELCIPVKLYVIFYLLNIALKIANTITIVIISPISVGIHEGIPKISLLSSRAVFIKSKLDRVAFNVLQLV